MDDIDRRHLIRCVDLAEEALAGGNSPFGSVLVAADGRVLREDYNRNGTGDATMHPEFELARWAANNLTPSERAKATVYTSGEHCPMCSAAHAWVGLGRIVYASSSEQRTKWMDELGAPPLPVEALPIKAVAPHLEVDGPDLTLADRIRDLHRRRYQK